MCIILMGLFVHSIHFISLQDPPPYSVNGFTNATDEEVFYHNKDENYTNVYKETYDSDEDTLM